MRITALGTVAVSHGENSVSGLDLGGRRARLALVALALAEHPPSAQQLATVVWGDELPATWKIALRGVVHGLRQVCAGLGPPLILTVPSGYALAPDVEVDVADVAEHVQQATRLVSEGRHRAALLLVEPAAAVTGDQLLPGEDADWLEPHRRRIDALAADAAATLVAAYSGLDRHRDAVRAARRMVDAHPLEESAYRSLIRAFDRAGDRAGAVGAYELCRATLADELGVDPSQDTIDVYLAALRDQLPTARAPIPAPGTSFVGRATELVWLRDHLRSAGLVTVAGRGGVGKTRLTAEAARASHEFVERLWVSLGSVSEDALVASSVALTLGVSPNGQDVAGALGRHLAPLGRVLLVLDNCELVVDAVASLAASLTAAAPALTVLATNRSPLGVDGERVLLLPPMRAAPDGVITDDLQIRLLADRVRESGNDLVLTDDVAPYVLAVRDRCGGLPLALELAAAQLTSLPAGDVLDHLREFATGDDDTVRIVARTSYELLSDDEATVFRRLAVIEGSVTLSVVRPVVADHRITPIRVMRILRELVAHGLLTADRTGPHVRYQQDDDLHRFARQLLQEGGEDVAAYVRLADTVRALLPDDARAAPGPFRAAVLPLLGSIRSLFLAALRGQADVDRAQELAFRLHRFFTTTGVGEGRYWLKRLLEARPDGPWSPYATYALGYLSYWSGATDDALRDLDAAAQMLEHAPDGYRARALIFVAGLFDDLDRGPESIERVQRSIEAAAPFDVDLQCSAAMGMGSVLAERANPDAARYAHDAIALCRAEASTDQLAMMLATAAMICWQVGDLDSARHYVTEALPMNAEPGRISRVVLLSAAAGVALADGDLDSAEEFGRTADREATDLGVEREVPLIRAVLTHVLVARGDTPGALRAAAGALEVALGMTIDYPLANGLEAAALVGDVVGVDDPGLVQSLLAHAQILRRRGDRPGPVPLSGAIAALRTSIDASEDGGGLDARTVATRAVDVLTHCARSLPAA